jgi:hypothetical protein
MAKHYEFIQVKSNNKIKATENKKILVVNTIFTDWHNNLNPVIRSVKYALKNFDYDVFQAKIEITKEEESEVVNRIKNDNYCAILQVYDSYYFPRDFLIENIYKKLGVPIFYYCYDYLAYPFGKYRKYYEEEVITISNVENIKQYNPKIIYALNLNSFILNNKYQEPLSKPFNIIYYGSFRKNRVDYFKKYLKYPMILSTSKRRISKFKEFDCVDCDIIEPLDWRNPLLKYFKYSLYIEDKYTHENYNYMASRFYEALNYLTIPVFDKSCMNTIEKSGYKIRDDYIIDGLQDLGKLEYDKEYVIDLFKQAKKEKLNVLKQVRDILLKYIN